MKRNVFKIDYWLLAPVGILVIISLTVLLSLNIDFFKSQLLSVIAAFIAFLFFSQLSPDFLKQMKVPFYVISLMLLAIVLIIGIESRGAMRWIELLGVRIQLSEVLRPFLVISFAAYLSDRQYPTKRTFFLTLGLIAPVFALVALQPDLGNALIYAFVTFFALLVTGFPLLWFALILLPVTILSPLLWLLLHDYQRQRILTFLDPTSDPLGTSYNTIQAIIAVGSGSFFGKGLSEGTQSGLRFLPERQTDFIFATLAEGLGFFGALIVILSIVFLCYRIYIVFQNSNDAFSRIFAACTFGFLLIQFFVNIGMNVGFLPIVGVTLPFVSFGGSSLLSNFIFLGILSSLSTSQKHKDVLVIR